MTPPLPITPRTLRCANGSLYLAMAICTIAAAAYAIACGRLHEPWHIAAAAGGGLLALLWGGYYAALRYKTDATGLTHTLLWSSRSYPWASLVSCTSQSTETRGVARCALNFIFTEGSLCISSDLFPLEDVQDLRQELIEAELLKLNPEDIAE